MQLLKQSTTATVTVGPVLDADGVAVTTAVLADFSIAKNGSVAVLTGATVTHSTNGYYTIALTVSNTDSLGRLDIIVNNSAMSMTNHRYDVLVAATYDAVVTTGVATAAEAAAIQADTNDIQTRLPAALVSGRIDASVGAMASNVITAASMASDASGEIADAVWDEVLTGATHNVAASAGRRLRQLASVIVHSGTAQGAGTGNNQIQLDTGASSINGAYDPGLVYIETGTGAGQTRLILQYNGTTKVATVDRDWRVNPDNTSEFVILGDAGRESVNEGLAQAATTTTITLNTSASTSDDAYNGQLVFIRSGTGQDQIALVEDYVGSTKVATIRTRSANGEWAIVPDTTSAYVMIPNLTWTIAEIQAGLATTTQLTTVETKIDTLDNYVDTEVAAIKAVTDKLDTTVVLDGAVYQFTANALELGPSGNVSVTVAPLSATSPDRITQSTVQTLINDTSAVGPIAIKDSSGNAVSLSGLTLKVCIEKIDGTVLANLTPTISGASNNQVTFTPNADSVSKTGTFRWALRQVSDGKVYGLGEFVVDPAAKISP
jgi:hypothetical protein